MGAELEGAGGGKGTLVVTGTAGRSTVRFMTEAPDPCARLGADGTTLVASSSRPNWRSAARLGRLRFVGTSNWGTFCSSGLKLMSLLPP